MNIFKLFRKKTELPRLPKMDRLEKIVYVGERLKSEGYIKFGYMGKINKKKYIYKASGSKDVGR